MGINKPWRRAHNDVWQAQKKRYYEKNSGHDYKAYKRYTQEETDLILNKEMPDADLCVQLGRTLKAIHVYRCKKLLERDG